MPAGRSTSGRTRGRFSSYPLALACIALGALLMLPIGWQAAWAPAVSAAEEASPAPGGGSPGPEAVPAVPPEVEAAAHEWPMGGRDYANTRATMDAAIDSSNVHELGIAWALALHGVGDWGAAASTPLIADDVVYFQDLQSNVTALDLETGDVIWLREYGRRAIGPNGPAIGWGKVFVQDGTESLIALDIDSGEELWVTRLEPHTGTHQPHVYGGYVYTGTGAGRPPEAPPEAVGRQSYPGGASGMVYAVEQATGRIAWRFQVVEEGFWGNPEVNGGGAIWYPPGIDTETGMTFWGTGNPAPFPGTIEWPNASSRPGPNLYSNSLLAIDGRSGELEWFHQAKPHDLFDLDFQGGPVLATATGSDEEERDIVIGWGKLGYVYAYDRESGEVVWRVPVGEHLNDELQELPPGEEVLVMPGVWGGVETPIALADGAVYVLTNDLGSPYTATGHDAEDAAEAVAAAEGRTELSQGHGIFTAIDVDDGTVLWEREFEVPAFGGATVVNDLVFTATLDGTIHALSREDGQTVWSMQAPGGINAWPAVAGETIVWPAGVGRQPTLIALRLGATGVIVPPRAGRTPEAPPPSPTSEASPTGSPTASPTPEAPSPTPQVASPTPPAGSPTPGAASPTLETEAPSPTPEAASPPPDEDGEAVTIELVAEDIEFDTDSITVPAGAEVSLTLVNLDRAPHNFALYETDAADQELFVGETFGGPDQERTYEFSAPDEPGEYFFRCDVHPVQMTGVFIVE